MPTADKHTYGTWYDIEIAPKDGTWIQAEIPGNGSDNIIAWIGGLLDSHERECGGWTFIMEEREPPDCWTDGICWEVNEDGLASVKPTKWMPLPQPPDQEVQQ